MSLVSSSESDPASLSTASSSLFCVEVVAEPCGEEVAGPCVLVAGEASWVETLVVVLRLASFSLFFSILANCLVCKHDLSCRSDHMLLKRVSRFAELPGVDPPDASWVDEFKFKMKRFSLRLLASSIVFSFWDQDFVSLEKSSSLHWLSFAKHTTNAMMLARGPFVFVEVVRCL